MRTLSKNPTFDGLRGVAILLVLIAHAEWPPRGGVLGVDLFFVLSGFLITSLLLTAWHSTDGRVSLVAFYYRRALRLLPALALLLTVYVYYGLVTRSIGSPSHVLTAAAISAGYVTNLFVTFQGGLIAHRMVHLWSLAAEEQFYVLWPPILLVALRRRVRPVTLAWLLVGAATAITVNAAILAAGGASYGRLWYAPDTHSAAILLGCAAALAWTYRLLTVPRWIAAILAVAVLALLFAYDFSPGFAVVTIPAFALAAGAGLLFVADNEAALVSRLLRMKMLQRVGRISYGIYLWHLPLMIFAGPVSGAILAFPIAAASYRWVEQPFLRRKAGVSMASPRVAAVAAPNPV